MAIPDTTAMRMIGRQLRGRLTGGRAEQTKPIRNAHNVIAQKALLARENE